MENMRKRLDVAPGSIQLCVASRKDGWIAFRADEVQALAPAHRAQPHLNPTRPEKMDCPGPERFQVK
jgi:hypothetical protein